MLGVFSFATVGSSFRAVLLTLFRSDTMPWMLLRMPCFSSFSAFAATASAVASACCLASFIFAAFSAKSPGSSSTTASALVSACLIKFT
jgi:hypothetical protein